MNLGVLQRWLGLVSGVFALVAGLVTALWAYAKFVLERGLLPPIQFDVECSPAGLQGDKKVLEVLIHLKNLGSSTLVAKNVRADVLYLKAVDKPGLFDDATKSTFGRLCFPHSLRKELERRDASPASTGSTPSPDENPVAHGRETGTHDQRGSGKFISACRARLRLAKRPKVKADKPRGFSILEYDTFVQPGVDQVYTLVTAVPASTTYVLVWSSFQYAQHPSLLQRFILFLSRRLGLLQYSLRHVGKPHTIERVFRIAEEQAEE
jgi:hypothetical protein